MALERKVYDVHINPDGFDPAVNPFDTTGVVTHRVVVTHADQLRGELEAAKRGIAVDAGQNITSIILWLALARLGHYTGRYEQFRAADCAGMESVEPPTGTAPDAVPPTVEPSGSVSDSPTSGPDWSQTGSTPT